MDTTSLVNDCQKLLQRLDQSKYRPLVAILVRLEEYDSWKLWMVPPLKSKKEDFFLEISKIFTEIRESMEELNIGMVEFKNIADKTIELIGRLFSIGGIGAVYVNNTTVNGILLPECIIFRSEL